MKKGKAAKKVVIAVVTAVAVGGVSVGGYYGIRQAQKTTVKVYPVSDFTSDYWEDSMNMEGQITSTASQNIYLSDSQTISQVLVKEGDVVNAGDTLMTYDTSMIELDLETQQLQLAQTKLKIQQSEKELEKLKKTKPVADTPLDPVEPDFPDFPDFPDEPIDPDFPDEPIPTPEPEPTYEDAVLYSSTNKLVFGSKPYKGEGTQEDPYTYLCAPGTVLTGGFLNQMAGYADEKGTKKEEDSEGYWFRLEIHEENKAAEALETVWEQEQNIKGVSLYGYHSPSEHEIHIASTLQDTAAFSTLTHEFGHALAHGSVEESLNTNLHQKEFEADVMSIMFCQHYGLEITDERKSHLSGHYKDWKKSDPNNFHPDKSMRKMFDLFREHSTVLDQKIVKAFPELATKLLPQELEVNSEKKKVVNKTAKRKPKKKKTPRL